MVLKKYLILGVGIITGFGLSVVGVSYASQNLVSNVKQVTPEVAKSIMLNKVPGANILEFSYDGDDKTPKYDGTLIKDNYEYEVDVNAKTGQIIKFEKEAIFTPNSNGNVNNASANTQQSTTQQSTTQQNSTQNNNASTTRKAYIGESKAKSIMLNKVPGATISKFYLDNDATPEYDGELIKGDYEYDISVDAVTGEIREFSKERIRNYNNPTTNNSTSTNSNTNANNNVPTNNNGSATNRTYIGESKAKSIMLSKVPGATIRGFHFDNDSTPEYEAELIKDGYEYDISVNALTGGIIEFSKERIEPYDDDRYDYDDDYDDRYDDDDYDDRYDD
nr:PepSY domain-containing protein [uncultured Romboutsia sp.]